LKFVEIWEVSEIKNEIKMEPESPNTQFSLSPLSSLNYSESEDSDKQTMRFSNQEISNNLTQNMDTKVYSIIYNVKKR